jgi:hypothetical protein
MGLYLHIWLGLRIGVQAVGGHEYIRMVEDEEGLGFVKIASFGLGHGLGRRKVHQHNYSTADLHHLLTITLSVV